MMIESKNYIPAYGTNNRLYWFPMKVALSRVFTVGLESLVIFATSKKLNNTPL